jgi:hypothetical protein
MASATVATIECEITDQEKMFQGSFQIQLFREATLLYERRHWGLQEEWVAGTSHETTSSDLSPRDLPAHGNYRLRVVIDEGDLAIAVHAKWSISIVTTDGDTLVSDPFIEFMDHQIREFETPFVL